jgi:hypothetical protein
MIDYVARSLLHRVSLVALAAMLSLTLASGACVDDPSSADCPNAETADFDTGTGSSCTTEPTGQICDRETMSCTSICDASEYLMDCRGGGFGIQPLVDGLPRIESACRVARVSGDGASRETLYCCRCGE